MFTPGRTKPDLIVHSEQPYNAEPKLHRLRAAMMTAQADFYVRSHGNVPHLDEAAHRLRVCGRVRHRSTCPWRICGSAFPSAR